MERRHESSERKLQLLPQRAIAALGSRAANLLVEKFGMGIYSNRQIFEAYEKGHIAIDPFKPKHVNGSSYDVLLGQYFYHSGYSPDMDSADGDQAAFFNGFDEDSTKEHFGEVMEGTPLREHRSVLERLDPKVLDGEGESVSLKNLSADQDIIILRPGERVLAHTHEFIGIRAPGTTSMQARSTIGRLGVVVCMDAGWGDPGYINRWTMEIKNHNEQYTVVPIGIRIAQIVFRHTGPVEGEYSNLSGKYQTTSSDDLDEIKANWQPSDMLPRAYKDTIVPLPPIEGLKPGNEMMHERGKYIVIEGIDATGKSTQVEQTRRWLADHAIESVEFHEPAGAPIANEIRTIIKNGNLDRDPITNVLLFTASRRETWRQIGQPALKLGKWAIAARNWYSTQVYQGNAEGVPFKEIEDITHRFMPHDYHHPDLTIMLTIFDEEERERRIKERGVLDNPDTFESRDAQFQDRLHKGYSKVSQLYRSTIVDATGNIDDVQSKIRDIIKPLIDER